MLSVGMAGVRQASHRWEEQKWWGGSVCVHCSTGLQGPLRGRGTWRADPPPRCPSRAADPWKVHKREAMQLGNAGGSSFSCKRLLSSGHEG